MSDDPRVLTEDEVANRLERAALRTWRIMADLRQLTPDMVHNVRHSRRLSAGVLEGLAAELQVWGVKPVAYGYEDVPPEPEPEPGETWIVDGERL